MTLATIVEETKHLPPQDKWLLVETLLRDLRAESGLTHEQPESLDQRRAALRWVVDYMAAHPLSANAPVLTRDELHERR